MVTKATSKFRKGDWIVFRKTKFSEHPTPRAIEVTPSRQGDGYTYVVEKYWVVVDTLDNGDLVVCTRRGKRHTISPDDYQVRKASLWDRFARRGRFLETSEVADSDIFDRSSVAAG